MGFYSNGAFHEAKESVPSDHRDVSDTRRGRSNRAGCRVREDGPPASQNSGCSREIAWPRIRLDGRLLAMGWQTHRIRLDTGQMAAPASGRCGMGWTEVAARSWRLRLRGGPLALNEIRSLGLHSATAMGRRGEAVRVGRAKPGPRAGRSQKSTAGLKCLLAAQWAALLQIGDNTASVQLALRTFQYQAKNRVGTPAVESTIRICQIVVVAIGTAIRYR